MASILEIIMRSKAIARKLNQGSSGDEFEPINRHNPHSLGPQADEHELQDYRGYQSGGGGAPTNIPTNLMDQLYSGALRDRSAERFLTEMSALQELLCELDIRENGVFAKVFLRRGTRFGPFSVTNCDKPADRKLAWEAGPNDQHRGWLETRPEVAAWLRKIRSVNNAKEANLQDFIAQGDLWYEASRDISAGEEISIDAESKILPRLNDIFSPRFNYDNRSEKENGSQYSGNTTGDDEFNTSSNDQDNNLKSENNNRNVDNKSDKLQPGEHQDTDDENGIDIRCEVCEKPYYDLDRLDEHLVAAHHYRKDEYSCDLCVKSYSYRPSLLKHRALVHNDIRKYPCENCTKVFCDPSNLQRHIRAHHVGARSHACPECGKTFATSSGLKQHTHIHSSVKPFQCEVCFKAYTQFSNLCRHKRMHANCRMQIKCNKCGSLFSTVTSLSKHKRFCDSTAVAPPSGIPSHHHNHHQHPHHPQMHHQSVSNHSSQRGLQPPNGMPSAMNTPPNPFFMFRSPPSFFPPGFPSYGLPGMFPPSPAQTSNFPLLFPKPAMDISIPPPSDKEAISPPMRHLSQRRSSLEKSYFPQSMRHMGNNEDIKPLTVMPPKKSPDSRKFTPQSPRSNHSRAPDDETNSSFVESKPIDVVVKKEEPQSHNDNDDADSGDEKKHINVTTPSPPAPEEASTSNGEQPLDLTVGRKRKLDEECTPEVAAPITPNTTQTEDLEPVRKRLSSDEPPKQTYQVNSPAASVSPGPTPSPSPPNNGPEVMACPQPIYPMLMAFYNQARQPGVGVGSDFSRPFPFLGPMGGRPNFDHLLHRNGPYPPKSNFHDALMAAGAISGGLTSVPGKIKDRYTCKFCGKVFPRSANLTRHLRTHTGEQPYTCKYCERAFSISSNLQRHVRNIHNKERPFRCHLCDRCFGQQTNLDRHLKKHEADTSGLGIGLGDSPSSNEADREDSYFDEIRSFMGQVTYNEDLYTPTSIGGGENDTECSSDVENDITPNSTKDPTNNNEAAIEVTT